MHAHHLVHGLSEFLSFLQSSLGVVHHFLIFILSENLYRGCHANLVSITHASKEEAGYELLKLRLRKKDGFDFRTDILEQQVASEGRPLSVSRPILADKRQSVASARVTNSSQ